MDGYLIYGTVSVFRMYGMTPEIRSFFGWIGMTGFKWGYMDMLLCLLLALG